MIIITLQACGKGKSLLQQNMHNGRRTIARQVQEILHEKLFATGYASEQRCAVGNSFHCLI